MSYFTNIHLIGLGLRGHLLPSPNLLVPSAETLLSTVPPQEPRGNQISLISVTSMSEQREICRSAAFCSCKLAYGKDKEDSPPSQFVMLLLVTPLEIRLTALVQLKRSNVKMVQRLLKSPRKATLHQNLLSVPLSTHQVIFLSKELQPWPLPGCFGTPVPITPPSTGTRNHLHGRIAAVIRRGKGKHIADSM